MYTHIASWSTWFSPLNNPTVVTSTRYASLVTMLSTQYNLGILGSIQLSFI